MLYINCYICGLGNQICSNCALSQGIKTLDSLEKQQKPLQTNTNLDVSSAFFQCDYDLTKEKHTIEKRRKEGYTIIYSSPKTLLLDIDNEGSIQRFFSSIDFFDKQFPISALYGWHSKSSLTYHNRFHIVIRLEDEYPIGLRFFMQSILGSDSKRELFNLAKNKIEHHECMLFRPPSYPIIHKSAPIDSLCGKQLIGELDLLSDKLKQKIELVRL